MLVIPVKEILICLPIHYTTAWKEEVCFVLFFKKTVFSEREYITSGKPEISALVWRKFLFNFVPHLKQSWVAQIPQII